MAAEYRYSVRVTADSESQADVAIHTALGRMAQDWKLNSSPRLPPAGSEFAEALKRSAAVHAAPESVSDADKLLFLADLFDAVDREMLKVGDTEIQTDLRRIAHGLNHPYGD